MKKIEVTIYEFKELSDKAKEKARAWWREVALDSWWDGTYEDAERVGLKISSFDLDRREIEADFTAAAYGCANAIVREHGDSCDTYKTAQKYLKDRAVIYAKFPQDENGDFIDYRGGNDAIEELNISFLKALLDDYLAILRKDYEYQLSDECVDENIEANDYEFTADGERFVTQGHTEPVKPVRVTAPADFTVHFSGSVSLFVPLTPAAKSWLAEHCPNDGEHQYLGPNLAVEARYLDGLIEQALADGLTK